jgi:hypothetical protein
MIDWLFPPFKSVEEFVGTLLIIVMYVVYAWYVHIRTLNWIKRQPEWMQYLLLIEYRFGGKR